MTQRLALPGQRLPFALSLESSCLFPLERCPLPGEPGDAGALAGTCPQPTSLNGC